MLIFITMHAIHDLRNQSKFLRNFHEKNHSKHLKVKIVRKFISNREILFKSCWLISKQEERQLSNWINWIVYNWGRKFKINDKETGIIKLFQLFQVVIFWALKIKVLRFTCQEPWISNLHHFCDFISLWVSVIMRSALFKMT